MLTTALFTVALVALIFGGVALFGETNDTDSAGAFIMGVVCFLSGAFGLAAFAFNFGASKPVGDLPMPTLSGGEVILYAALSCLLAVVCGFKVYELYTLPHKFTVWTHANVRRLWLSGTITLAIAAIMAPIGVFVG